MPNRADDWFRQAEKDLEHARTSLKAGDFEWACFASHQAAEKALKALFQSLGGEFFGHSILRMLKTLPSPHAPGENLLKRAASLDKLYIPTRYPNGFDQGAPLDFFLREDAVKAIEDASEIVRHAGSRISRP